MATRQTERTEQARHSVLSLLFSLINYPGLRVRDTGSFFLLPPFLLRLFLFRLILKSLFLYGWIGIEFDWKKNFGGENK
jgi:hypothetical protein